MNKKSNSCLAGKRGKGTLRLSALESIFKVSVVYRAPSGWSKKPWCFLLSKGRQSKGLCGRLFNTEPNIRTTVLSTSSAYCWFQLFCTSIMLSGLWCAFDFRHVNYWNETHPCLSELFAWRCWIPMRWESGGSEFKISKKKGDSIKTLGPFLKPQIHINRNFGLCQNWFRFLTSCPLLVNDRLRAILLGFCKIVQAKSAQHVCASTAEWIYSLTNPVLKSTQLGFFLTQHLGKYWTNSAVLNLTQQN